LGCSYHERNNIEIVLNKMFNSPQK
jgi:hypothetical protein